MGSLCPADILTPAWNAYMRSEGRHRPLYFVGSGKTAMDCIYHLCHTDTDSIYKTRIHCIAGRGMQFINRDLMFPDSWWKMNMFGQMTPVDWMLPMLEMYDGDNEQDVFAALRSKGFFHSAVPDPQNFIFGILSVHEMKVCRGALSPADERVHKAHLMAIQNDPDDDQRAVLKLRQSSGLGEG